MTRAILALALAAMTSCASTGSASPEGHICREANVLYLSETSQTGPLGAYSGKYVGQLATTRQIIAETKGLKDQQLRAQLRDLAANLTRGHLANPRFLAVALHTCRQKGYLTGG
jgi:hypothetical protein